MPRTVASLAHVFHRVDNDYSTVIGVGLDDNSMPALFFHMDDLSGMVDGFWGLGLFPLPPRLGLD